MTTLRLRSRAEQDSAGAAGGFIDRADLDCSREPSQIGLAAMLTAALLAAEHDGAPLRAAMVLGCVRQLIVTGMVAPSVLIGNMFVHLARDQSLQRQLREHPADIPAAVEEFLRMDNPYRGMATTARHDTVVVGQQILRGRPGRTRLHGGQPGPEGARAAG